MEIILNGNGVIEEILSKEGKKGEFFKVKINSRMYNSFDLTESFNQLTEKLFKVGEPVDFEYTEHENQGTTYKNLIRLVKLETKEAEKTIQKAVESNENGNKTGNQIVRMNSLSNAIGFFNLNKEVAAYNTKGQPVEAQAVSQDMILKIAEQFENWVRR
jgi:hypothetical protein